jgi:D-serine deaminase-like pyridoxal phosphate-dependent protein
MTGHPHLRLDADAVEHNIATMATWCAAHGVALAPHVKTTMSEPIVALQVAAGADRLTVATVDQAATVRSWGHRRILIANEVVERDALARMRAWLDDDEAFEIACLVDSTEGVRIAAAAFSGVGPVLPVLIDVGTPGGRTGVRTVEVAVRLGELVAAEPALRLVGVSGYEGVVGGARNEATLEAVDGHCHRVGEVFDLIAADFETDHPLLTMGGSVFTDRVAAALSSTSTPLLRSGCYVTHDHGIYARTGPALGLRPALSVRAVVLSRPEAGMAVVGAGRRELPFDAGVPTVLGSSAEVSVMYDHHTVLTNAGDLEVGEVVEFGISHPCSAFDRWDSFVVTRGRTEVDVWRTSFPRGEAVQ